MEQTQLSQSIVEFKVDEALDVLRKNNGLSIPSVPLRCEVFVHPLQDWGCAAKFDYKEANGLFLYTLTFDISKIMEHARKNKLPLHSLLDFIVGEEAGHLIHQSINPALFYWHNKSIPGLYPDIAFMMEVIGHYAGLVYCNREDNGEIFGLGMAPNYDEIIREAYTTADKIYEHYGIAKLPELLQIKGITEFYRRIRRLNIK